MATAPLTLLLALNHAAAARDVAHDEAGVLLGSFDFDSHDGLENDGVRLAQSVLDGHRASNLEGGFRGVDFMVRTVDELDANVLDRVASQNASMQRFLDALVDSGDVFLGNNAADRFLFSNR